MQFRFLGYGSSDAPEYGESAAVFERDGKGKLMIDCGQSAVARYIEHYEELPSAIYLTHTHWDHIGGLEPLFYKAYFTGQQVKLFVHAALIERLTAKLAHGDSILAEGNANFWDAFQLIPIHSSFWLDGLQFEVFESRHHQSKFCFGLRLPGHFVYTGDTKPIPETLATYANRNELIFHDLSIYPQPSHTFIEELDQYPSELLTRMWFYHLNSGCEQILEQHQLRSVLRQSIFDLTQQKKPSGTETQANRATPETESSRCHI